MTTTPHFRIAPILILRSLLLGERAGRPVHTHRSSQLSRDPPFRLFFLDRVRFIVICNKDPPGAERPCDVDASCGAVFPEINRGKAEKPSPAQHATSVAASPFLLH